MKQITSLTDKKFRLMINVYSALLIGLFLFSACDQQEDKKVDKTSTEQPQDSVPAPQITEEIKQVPEIVFTVQVAALKRNNPTLTKLSSIHVMDENGLKKYRLHSFSSYQEAKNFKKTIQSKYPDAFIQALKNGSPIDIHQALK